MDLTTLGAFHFLHPAWLLCLPPLLLWAISGIWRRRQRGAWVQVVDADLLPALRLATAERSGSPWPLIALAWTCARARARGSGLASRSERGLSRSGRLGHRARSVADDVGRGRQPQSRDAPRAMRSRISLRGARDARVGLIVFSGEAHVVVPLTSDVATIRALLPPLSPGIMPEGGDDVAPALDAAAQLLHEAASRNGKVVVLTDGFTDDAQALVSARALAQQGASVEVIGVGTREGRAGRECGREFRTERAGHERAREAARR